MATAILLPILAGAGILGASYYASEGTRQVDFNVEEFMETRKKGLNQSVVRAQQAISGAQTPFSPFPAPNMNAKTITEVQQSYSDDITTTMVEQAKFNLRPKGKSRIPIANTGNAPYLIKQLGSGNMGGIKGAETLNNNPMALRGNVDFRQDRDLPGAGTGVGSGFSTADSSSQYWTPNNAFLNPGGVTFNQRINPWARGGNIVTLQQNAANSARGKAMPVKGPLVPVPQENRKGTNIVM